MEEFVVQGCYLKVKASSAHALKFVNMVAFNIGCSETHATFYMETQERAELAVKFLEAFRQDLREHFQLP
jgi:hypothetical protein